jgi:CDP-diacylglycerol--glycerol-3-phosphate 3-phosphatidyltransferase
MVKRFIHSVENDIVVTVALSVGTEKERGSVEVDVFASAVPAQTDKSELHAFSKAKGLTLFQIECHDDSLALELSEVATEVFLCAFADRLHLASNVGMAIALVLTAWSGVDYFMKCWPYVIGKRR